MLITYYRFPTIVPFISWPLLLIAIIAVVITLQQFSWNTDFYAKLQSVWAQQQSAAEIPMVLDPDVKIEKVYNGSAFPTNMAFIGSDDILLLEKDTGQVIRIKDGKNIGPVLNVQVRDKDEMGLLGIATAKSKQLGNVSIFLYHTSCKPDNYTDCNNFVDRYRWDEKQGKLVDSLVLLKLPALPGPSHQGGDMVIGPDGYLYIAIGDMTPTKLFNKDKNYETKAQNYLNGLEPDGRGGILRITQDGKPVGNGIFGSVYPLNLYYAYGIKNSFGIGFDPLTGNLWDTENGPSFGDEINLVKPGFNGGWNKVQGFWRVGNTSEKMEMIKGPPADLVNFGGKGKYGEPKLVWDKPVGPTALVFLNSTQLGEKYHNDIFVGSVKDGRIFHFKLSDNDNRTELSLPDSVTNKILTKDSIKNTPNGMIFAEHFGIITDLKVGPQDGYLYVVSGDKSSNVGQIYKIVPK